MSGRLPFRLLAAALATVLVLPGCGTGNDGAKPEEAPASRGPALFERHAPAATGVTFANRLAETPALNIINYLYYYNGGGVAVGDVSGDGRPDLYFTANEGPNKLYLNRGGFQFEDVTTRAGVAGTADWTTGVTMADVNGDGHRDLYVSVVSGALGLEGRNQLYVNNGDGTFTEQAEAYGLDFAGYGTQAAFFDYDRDGDLDCYLLNHSLHTEGTYGPASMRTEPHPRAGDRLLRNDGEAGTGGASSPHFTDVTAEAGIYSSKLGYGLGVAVSDLDGDGWPDLYVANDFHENDYLYYNDGDGTFTEAVEASAGHTSLSSMGVDAADFSGDGRPDLAVLDMLPAREAARKTTSSTQAYDVFQIKRRYGYQPQYTRNVLQLNQGRPVEGHPAEGRSAEDRARGVRFSEIGQLAGVAATDWSWAPLFADLDEDGRQDLFVTNGIYRRPNDLDYVNYTSRRAVQASLKQGVTEETLALLERMPRGRAPNYAFRNEGDLTFTGRAAAWGLAREGFSSGAAYADLDGDGDLDLAVNNTDAPAGLYENRADRLRSGHHALTVALVGGGKNTDGLGATVRVKAGGRWQMREQFPVRGFQSSVGPRLHFGLGAHAVVDSLVVAWPDGREEERTGVEAGQTLTLRQADAQPPSGPPVEELPAEERLFEDVSEALALPYRHTENAFDDFEREPLMPHKLSTEGPALAVADVNGDGREDVYAGGARGQPGRLLLQEAGGGFRPASEAASKTAWRADSLCEDVAAAFFDADGDGAADLYVGSAGNEFGEGRGGGAGSGADALRDRLYLGDGQGGFRRASEALPDDMRGQTGTVAVADYDGDGDADLFVGGRAVAGQYGRTPRSHLLENDGAGRFRDVTAARAPGLSRAGMVTSAVWTDTGGDGRLDLVVAGEWMPIRVFRQAEGGRLEERTEAAGLGRSHGWWTALRAADLDGDGDDDLVAGNLGLNSRLKAGPETPARLYLADFDGSGGREPILTFSRGGTASRGDTDYPLASHETLLQQIGPLRRKYRSYAALGARRVGELFPEKVLAEATVKRAYTFATSYAENRGDGTFALRPLPVRAQFAPVHGILAEDVDGDGRNDLVLTGGFHGVKPVRGRYDASYGHFLRGTGRRDSSSDSSDEGELFEAVPPAASGLWLEGPVRALRVLETAGGGRVVLAARNDRPLQAVRVRRQGRPFPER